MYRHCIRLPKLTINVLKRNIGTLNQKMETGTTTRTLEKNTYGTGIVARCLTRHTPPPPGHPQEESVTYPTGQRGSGRVREVMDRWIQELEEGEVPEARLAAEYIISHILSLSRVSII